MLFPRAISVSLVSLFLLSGTLSVYALEPAEGNDPAADTFGDSAADHDISRVEVTVTTSTANFLVEFFEVVKPPSEFAAESVVGYIDIDLDQNSLSGAVAKKNEFSPQGVIDLGTEYHIDLFSERFHAGEVELIDTATLQPVGRADVTYSPDSLLVTVPLDLLGGDRFFNYGVIVGDFLDMSDEAPNDGFGSTIPEPGALCLQLLALVLTAGVRFRIVSL